MENQTIVTVLLGLGGLAAIVFMFWSKWKDAKTLDGALAALKDIAQASQPNALIEAAMTGVVPRELLDKAIDKINTLAPAVEAWTPDDIDQLIEAARKYGISLIDGKPNSVG